MAQNGSKRLQNHESDGKGVILQNISPKALQMAESGPLSPLLPMKWYPKMNFSLNFLEKRY